MEESEQGNTAQVELPRYKSHKEVHAFKIGKIELDMDKAQEENRETDGSALLSSELPLGFVPIKVDREYLTKHKPQVGGYYVVYKDGYRSFSPADAFEEGYTLIR